MNTPRNLSGMMNYVVFLSALRMCVSFPASPPLGNVRRYQERATSAISILNDQNDSMRSISLSSIHHHTTRSSATTKTKLKSTLSSSDSNTKRNKGNQDDDDENGDPSLLIKTGPESTFWYATPQNENMNDYNNGLVVPCMPNLDSEGPLPLGAYRPISTSVSNADDENDVKKTCIVTIAIDLEISSVGTTKDGWTDTEINAKDIVRGMQDTIDCGFTSYQIAQHNDGIDRREWGETHVFGALRKEVPASVFSQCQFNTRIDLPDKDVGLAGVGVGLRSTITDSLLRIGGDCLDQVQVGFCKDSPYFLDVLDILTDLQREGTIQSISGINVPSSALLSAQDCRFHLDTNQMQCNTLDRRVLSEVRPTMRHVDTKLMPSSPLLGGLLSDNYYMPQPRSRRRNQPLPMPPPLWELSASQRDHLKTVQLWASSSSPSSSNDDNQPPPSSSSQLPYWNHFQQYMLTPIHDISYKHQVSMASVALRWALQVDDNLASVVVSNRIGREVDSSMTRARDLREVFTFELEQEDLDCLEEAASTGRLPRLEPENYGLEHMLEYGSSAGREEYGDDHDFMKDLNDKRFWLLPSSD